MAKRITITVSDEEGAEIERLAQVERRKEAQMGTVLIQEALAARAKAKTPA